MKRMIKIVSTILLAMFILNCLSCNASISVDPIPTPEPKAVLTNIEISKMPSKTKYYLEQEIQIEGMEITAVYSDGERTIVSGWTVTGFDSSAPVDEQEITVSYEEDGITVSTSFKVVILDIVTICSTSVELNSKLKSFDGRGVSVVLLDYDKDIIHKALMLNEQKLVYLTLPEGIGVIGDTEFLRCTNLAEVVIPAGVTSIGSGAFSGCSGLTEVVIPAGVTSIGSGAFSGCSSLTEVVIPAEVTSIESSLFSGCSSLTKVVLPTGVTSIKSYVFSDCNSLSSVYIPASVTSIEKGAFSKCTSIKSLTVDDENPVFDSRDGCNAIIDKKTNTLMVGCCSTVIPDSVTSIADYAFEYVTGLTSIIIPSSVTGIGDAAFSFCSDLSSLELSEGLLHIGEDAFWKCSELTSVTIPASVTDIGFGPFAMCSKLTSIRVDKDNKNFDSRNDCNAIIYKEHNLLAQGCKSTIIPDDVKEICSYAFYGLDSLQEIFIPKNVLWIANCAFAGCMNMKSIVFENTSGWNMDVSDPANNAKNLTKGAWYNIALTNEKFNP